MLGFHRSVVFKRLPRIPKLRRTYSHVSRAREMRLSIIVFCLWLGRKSQPLFTPDKNIGYLDENLTTVPLKRDHLYTRQKKLFLQALFQSFFFNCTAAINHSQVQFVNYTFFFLLFLECIWLETCYDVHEVKTEKKSVIFDKCSARNCLCTWAVDKTGSSLSSPQLTLTTWATRFSRLQNTPADSHQSNESIYSTNPD